MAAREEESRLRDLETEVFASLKIWRDKLAEDLAQPERGPDFKLRLLLEQSRDVELAVQGCLKDTLFELSECVQWGLVEPAFAEQQRINLYNQAAVELNNDKQLCLQLAKEQGVEEAYARELKRSVNHTVADYERIGDLKFALLVWRANLLRDTSLAAGGGGGGAAVEGVLREGYYDALRLIKRCASKSARFWSVRHTSGQLELVKFQSRPVGGEVGELEAGKRKVYEGAVQLVQRRLATIAEQRGVAASALDPLFAEVSDPDAVPLVEEYSDTPERPGREGVYEPSADAGKEQRVHE